MWAHARTRDPTARCHCTSLSKAGTVPHAKAQAPQKDFGSVQRTSVQQAAEPVQVFGKILRHSRATV